MAKCYCCEKEIDDSCIDSSGREYELKTGGKVQVCFVCENDEYQYVHKIKADCLIDGRSYDVTAKEKKNKKNLEAKNKQFEQDEIEWAKLIEGGQKVYWFCNRGSRKFEHNSALRYANEFLGNPDATEEQSLKRFMFGYVVECVNDVYLEDVVGLKWVKLILDGVSISNYKARKPGETEWQDRIRKWYYGRVLTSCDLYDSSFGFSWHSNDKKYGDVYMGYPYLCSKSWQMSNLVKEHIVSQLENGI